MYFTTFGGFELGRKDDCVVMTGLFGQTACTCAWGAG